MSLEFFLFILIVVPMVCSACCLVVLSIIKDRAPQKLILFKKISLCVLIGCVAAWALFIVWFILAM